MSKINLSLILASLLAFKFGYLLLASLSLSVVLMPVIFKFIGLKNSKVVVR